MFLNVSFKMATWQKLDAYDNEYVKKAAMLVLCRGLELEEEGDIDL